MLPAVLDAIAREKGLDPGDVEVWFGDEARIGPCCTDRRDGRSSPSSV